MSGGYDVDLEALHNAAEGIARTVGEVSGHDLSHVGGTDPGHGRRSRRGAVAALAGGRMTVVDRVPESWRTLFVEVLARRNPELLRDLHSQELPTDEQVQETKRLLQREFALHVDDDSEPTPRGRELDELTGDFIRRFVVEHT